MQTRFDWPAVHAALDAQGWALMRGLLDPRTCAALSASYARDELFRSRVHMQRHGYGRGEYQYFCYPLPAPVAELRTQLYEQLVATANRWQEMLGSEVRYPLEHAAFVEACHASGQTRPTPLLLKYRRGDYNCLHQDLYGERVFPLQVAVLLSRPEVDFEGGEFVLTEQRPRMQSRATVVPLSQGDAVVFAVEKRPVHRSASSDARVKKDASSDARMKSDASSNARVKKDASSGGYYRVNMRHGVSELRKGERFTLGIIFHDAT